jgi:hypothetical protein
VLLTMSWLISAPYRQGRSARAGWELGGGGINNYVFLVLILFIPIHFSSDIVVEIHGWFSLSKLVDTQSVLFVMLSFGKLLFG